MNQKQREYNLYLEDMLASMLKIQQYIKGMEFEGFTTNNLVIDAVIRNFEIIGEAAKMVPKKIQAKYPQIPWKQMYGLRNLIAHEYFGIDYELIWKIAANSLPQNLKDMEEIVKGGKNTNCENKR